MSVTIFVPDIPELMPLIEGTKKANGCVVRLPKNGYWRIEAEGSLTLDRKSLGLRPALWYSALSGGFRGRVVEYGRDIMRIEADDR